MIHLFILPTTLITILKIFGLVGKASVYNVGDLGSIPWLGRLPGEGNGNPLQYSCLENPMNGGGSYGHGVTKSQT